MPELPEILNWRRLDENTTLSGQPTEAQLAEIRALGVTHIVNLGPHDSDKALADEPATVAVLGMTYVHIPVDFENPTDGDYARFCAALARLRGRPIHVHCIYNARVTAFFYRHSRDGKGTPKSRAFALMDGIWRPGGVWARFIGDEGAVDLPNRYAGHDY